MLTRLSSTVAPTIPAANQRAPGKRVMRAAAVNSSLETRRWVKAVRPEPQRYTTPHWAARSLFFLFFFTIQVATGQSCSFPRTLSLPSTWGKAGTDKSWTETIFGCFLCSNLRFISSSEQTHWQEKLGFYMNFPNICRHQTRCLGRCNRSAYCLSSLDVTWVCFTGLPWKSTEAHIFSAAISYSQRDIKREISTM